MQIIVNNFRFVLKLYVVVLLSILFCSCRNKAPSSSAEDKKISDSLAKVKADTNNTRLVIRFYSIGSGAEFPFINGLEDSIGSYSLQFGKNIDYKINRWGREGETDFCLKLNELTDAEQKEFITKTKSQLESAKWVHIYEYYPCPDMSSFRK